jgi:hypothetical protein
MRLLQVDVAVRDRRATETEWAMGTFVWIGPRIGDGFFDNLQPVGLAWGDDPGKHNPQWNGFADLKQTALNIQLSAAIWQRGSEWPHRPFPGFQGRLNGPADNMRSSCISCHGLAQWPRSTKTVRKLGTNPAGTVNIVPRYKTIEPIDAGAPPLNAEDVKHLSSLYFSNVRGGTVADPSHMERPTGSDPRTKAAIPLDYSLQLEAALARMCRACAQGRLIGEVPTMCTAEQGGRITSKTCGSNALLDALEFLGLPARAPLASHPRQ